MKTKMRTKCLVVLNCIGGGTVNGAVQYKVRHSLFAALRQQYSCRATAILLPKGSNKKNRHRPTAMDGT